MLALRQLENHIEQEYFKFVTIRPDESKRSAEDIINLRKTRALVAYYLKKYANCPDSKIKSRITDGFNDKGIDGIYYNDTEKILHVIQTKWINNGNSGLDLGDMHKLLEGVRLLIIPDLSTCNSEIQQLAPEINTALLEPSIKVIIAIVATTIQAVPADTKSILEAFEAEQNTVTSYLSYEYLNLKSLHETLVNGSIDTPIDTELMLTNWSDIKSPVKAISGLINGNDLAALYEKHGKRLLAPNIRYFLGRTEVNESISQTIQSEPDHFWYYNNGITAIASSITKRALGGASHENGIFDCKELYIVNGAQTTGTILEAKKQGLVLDDVSVGMRIIEIAVGMQEFGISVTRKNNTQNRIDSRDFVSLDPTQEKIYQELLLEKIVYTFKAGDSVPVGSEGFSFEEGAIAMACSMANIELMVLTKREVSRLWSSTDKPPYRMIFNASTEGPKVWQNVKILRVVENWIKQESKINEGRDRLVLVHGNRYILMLTFILMDTFVSANKRSPTDPELEIMVSEAYTKLNDAVKKQYPYDQVASLFKNTEKCNVLKRICGI
jgi:hypothetical protein